MNLSLKTWRLIGIIYFVAMLGLTYFLFQEHGILRYGIHFINALLVGLLLLELRLLRRAPPPIRHFGWVLGALWICILIPQFFAFSWVLVLWNYSLGMLALLSGTVMYYMVGITKAGRAFVIFLSLCVMFLMILEFSGPLIHKIAIGAFVTGALICLHVLIAARSDDHK